MKVTLRDYEPADRSACLELFDGNTPPYFDVTERTDFERFLDSGPQPYFVLEGEGQILACGGLSLFPDEAAGVALAPHVAGLKWGMVRRDLHGRGVGTRLLHARLQWLRGHQPQVTEVRLATSQLTALYYRKQGFEVVSTVQDGFAPGLDRVEMCRSSEPFLQGQLAAEAGA